ncbi:phosphoadenosine phosphosulfate reductase family protein [Serratia sp. 1D1416]|uniref:phosphoadenosine phosphosulfate reductase family protein n=1 Tax=Serratia sp. 1D1416 TaxID=2447890 RepID=UPI001F5DA65F|nr:phosphoadenosine phosphosulfate reductase family protein [Serratia sp. 1D1416]
MINVVSFSGGRTSAYLAHLMRQQDPDTRFVFMDTGAEHPATYQFIRDAVKHWGIDLICLRVVVNPELGKGNGYRVISLDEIGPDLEPWRAMLEKYGTPYVGGEFCTDRMKLGPFKKYCDEHIGRKAYRTWIGIRADEPARLWGGLLHRSMTKAGMTREQTLIAYRSGMNTYQWVSEDWAKIGLANDFNTPSALLDKCMKRLSQNASESTSYLAEISDTGKHDVIDWWSRQPFDLGIPEHLGNCVFCIKKSIQKIALAAKDEPELAKQFWQVLNANSVRKMENRNGTDLDMYWGKNSFGEIITMFSAESREELAARMPSQQPIRAANTAALPFSGSTSLRHKDGYEFI